MYLPPVPYNYPDYTKYIIPTNAKLSILFKIIQLGKCKKTPPYNIAHNNFFDENTEYFGYSEIEIDLKQIDPTIQSISKFISSYKTIEISNINNLQVECEPPNIENFIPNRNIEISVSRAGCSNYLVNLRGLKI